jgi:2-keto-4-pentenoate hydratase/2-oxohepta-3-ene-1,7-dioic acid hydratase in catechol pathway
VKLCRFVLHDAPDQARSGIYHDGKVYETDGEHAIGIHDPGSLSLLTPLGTPPAIRLYQTYRRPNGDEALTFRFCNVTGLAGPNGEIRVTVGAHELDFDVHIVGIVGDLAEGVEPHEAPGFVLGYAILLQLYDADMADEARSLELPIGPSHDFGGALGPYLTTPDDLAEFTVGTDPTSFSWHFRARVNEVEVAQGSSESQVPFSQLLTFASESRAVQAGEVLGWPALKKPRLVETALERQLFPTDRIEVTVDGLGTLVARIA